MTRSRKFAVMAVACLVTGVTAMTASPASAWHAPNISGSVHCENGVQVATVVANNTEGEVATVRSSSGPVFGVGTIILAHSSKFQSFTKPGSFIGDVTVTFAVDYPSDGTDRPASVTLHFPDHCRVPPPTTVPQTIPPTTAPTTTAPPVVSTSVPHDTTTTVRTAGPAEPVPATPGLTG